jgi:hypothetical protein
LELEVYEYGGYRKSQNGIILSGVCSRNRVIHELMFIDAGKVVHNLCDAVGCPIFQPVKLICIFNIYIFILECMALFATNMLFYGV